jgi:hypothetical protein
MPISDAHLFDERPTTAEVHRPFGGLNGYRRISDSATRAVVHAFPMHELPRVAAAGLLGTAGAYVMTDGTTAYFGESGRPSHRLAKHAASPAKSFARDVFVVAGCEGAAFSKLLALDLQYRLTRRAIAVGAVTVWKGVNPAEPGLTDAERATHDRIVADALRLLYDVGCRIFHTSAGGDAPTQPEGAPPDSAVDVAETEPGAIGVTTLPIGSEEFELRYGGLWARGYWSAGRFIVSAGSEYRMATNGSVDDVTRDRRDELAAAGVLSPIQGVGDRMRFAEAFPFPTQSIAAKVLAGAHSAGRWVPRDPSQTTRLR